MDATTIISGLALIVAAFSLVVSIIAFKFQRKSIVAEKRSKYLSTILNMQMLYSETVRILQDAKKYESDSYEQYRIEERLKHEKHNREVWESIYSEWSENRDSNDIDLLEDLIIKARKEALSIEKYHQSLKEYLAIIKKTFEKSSNANSADS